jgi:hypothetical protein
MYSASVLMRQGSISAMTEIVFAIHHVMPGSVIARFNPVVPAGGGSGHPERFPAVFRL